MGRGLYTQSGGVQRRYRVCISGRRSFYRFNPLSLVSCACLALFQLCLVFWVFFWLFRKFVRVFWDQSVRIWPAVASGETDMTGHIHAGTRTRTRTCTMLKGRIHDHLRCRWSTSTTGVGWNMPAPAATDTAAGPAFVVVFGNPSTAHLPA